MNESESGWYPASTKCFADLGWINYEYVVALLLWYRLVELV